MTTAFSAYRAKQQKEKPARQKKDPNNPVIVMSNLKRAVTSIRLMDTTAWTDDDKTSLQTVLTNLRAEIEQRQTGPQVSTEPEGS